MYKIFSCALLLSSSYLVAIQEPRYNRPHEDIKIYNENYYPPNYGYYGYPYVETPAEAFPDDAEANYLFDKMHE